MINKERCRELQEAEYCSLTVREIYALWMMLNFDIHRYYMDNVRGGNKGEHHWRMSDIIAAFIMCDNGEYLMRGSESSSYAKIYVHDWLARELTDYLDEKIGLPLTDINPVTLKPVYINYSIYAERFFCYIISNWDRLRHFVEIYIE